MRLRKTLELISKYTIYAGIGIINLFWVRVTTRNVLVTHKKCCLYCRTINIRRLVILPFLDLQTKSEYENRFAYAIIRFDCGDGSTKLLIVGGVGLPYIKPCSLRFRFSGDYIFVLYRISFNSTNVSNQKMLTATGILIYSPSL